MSDEDEKIIWLWGKDELPEHMEWIDSGDPDELLCTYCGENNWAIKYDEEGRSYICCLTMFKNGNQCDCEGSIP